MKLEKSGDLFGLRAWRVQVTGFRFRASGLIGSRVQGLGFGIGVCGGFRKSRAKSFFSDLRRGSILDCHVGIALWLEFLVVFSGLSQGLSRLVQGVGPRWLCQ